jgi:dephospho-CoA kinase
MLFADGSLNRKKLGKLVFVDPDKLALLTSITHKYIKQEIYMRISSFKDNPVILDEDGNETPLRGVIIDAPLLFESGLHKICNAVVVVLADMELRIMRISQGTASPSKMPRSGSWPKRRIPSTASRPILFFIITAIMMNFTCRQILFCL